ncbi:hypothetical protein OUZ56_014720 [Daphnia magna]|uniref:Uncharacterized protein n=1 Tax=Daphnia magna TaxID=35525 RepID=A0ABR0AKM3_9CRUS|nr:hypothetical protein OUZ56_014720 [Daphnia magna]
MEIDLVKEFFVCVLNHVAYILCVVIIITKKIGWRGGGTARFQQRRGEEEGKIKKEKDPGVRCPEEFERRAVKTAVRRKGEEKEKKKDKPEYRSFTFVPPIDRNSERRKCASSPSSLAASKERNQSHVYIHQIGKEGEEEKIYLIFRVIRKIPVGSSHPDIQIEFFLY